MDVSFEDSSFGHEFGAPSAAFGAGGGDDASIVVSMLHDLPGGAGDDGDEAGAGSDNEAGNIARVIEYERNAMRIEDEDPRALGGAAAAAGGNFYSNGSNYSDAGGSGGGGSSSSNGSGGSYNDGANRVDIMDFESRADIFGTDVAVGINEHDAWRGVARVQSIDAPVFDSGSSVTGVNEHAEDPSFPLERVLSIDSASSTAKRNGDFDVDGNDKNGGNNNHDDDDDDSMIPPLDSGGWVKLERDDGDDSDASDISAAVSAAGFGRSHSEDDNSVAAIAAAAAAVTAAAEERKVKVEKGATKKPRKGRRALSKKRLIAKLEPGLKKKTADSTSASSASASSSSSSAVVRVKRERAGRTPTKVAPASKAAYARRVEAARVRLGKFGARLLSEAEAGIESSRAFLRMDNGPFLPSGLPFPGETGVAQPVLLKPYVRSFSQRDGHKSLAVKVEHVEVLFEGAESLVTVAGINVISLAQKRTWRSESRKRIVSITFVLTVARKMTARLELRGSDFDEGRRNRSLIGRPAAAKSDSVLDVLFVPTTPCTQKVKTTTGPCITCSVCGGSEWEAWRAEQLAAKKRADIEEKQRQKSSKKKTDKRAKRTTRRTPRKATTKNKNKKKKSAEDEDEDDYEEEEEEDDNDDDDEDYVDSRRDENSGNAAGKKTAPATARGRKVKKSRKGKIVTKRVIQRTYRVSFSARGALPRGGGESRGIVAGLSAGGRELTFFAAEGSHQVVALVPARAAVVSRAGASFGLHASPSSSSSSSLSSSSLSLSSGSKMFG